MNYLGMVNDTGKNLDGLKSIKICVVLVDWYCMCKSCCEKVDHLPIHCEVAWDLWSFVLTMFGVQWVMPKRVLDALFGWQSCFGKCWNSFVWNITPLCLMWSVWTEGSNCTFYSVEHSTMVLKSQFMRLLFEWSLTLAPNECIWL